MENSRQLAFLALKDIEKKGAYPNIALDRVLSKTKLSKLERSLTCELVYGVVRRQRTLDALIEQFGKKKAEQQPPNLRIILQLGLYQLRYLNQIPDSAAVNTSVELAKVNGLKNLAGVVNGILREYIRQAVNNDPLNLPEDIVKNLGILHSFPDWIIATFLEQLGKEETEQLCVNFNQTPTIDLRINILKKSLEEVEAAFQEVGVAVSPLPYLPQALRLTEGSGAVNKLPGFESGWWTVQDSSAQLVSHLLEPQPGEVIIDACAAPGGKTTHIAELMGDLGEIWAGDRDAKRLKKVQENAERLQLKSIKICPGDSRNFTHFTKIADRVLIDAPCSGLGTMHKRPDIRWRQTAEKIEELTKIQGELLAKAATWLKPGGILVYATCTLNRLENERVIELFLDSHPDWQIQAPSSDSICAPFVTTEGWIKVLPHRHQMDGFFMVKLTQG